MIRLYNKQTGWLGREQEDWEGLHTSDDVVKLEVVKGEKPENFNPETQRLVRLEPKKDLSAKTYTEGWEVIDLSEYEIAMKDWEGGDFAIKIVAPIELILDDFGVKMKGWFELKGLPIIPKGETVHLYCQEILPEFSETVQGLEDAGIIQVIDRPVEK